MKCNYISISLIEVSSLNLHLNVLILLSLFCILAVLSMNMLYALTKQGQYLMRDGFPLIFSSVLFHAQREQIFMSKVLKVIY